MSLQALELTDARRSHDPTGTSALRRTWRSVAEIRLRQLRAQLRIAVVEQDLLGLGGGLAQYTPAHVRLKAMQDWFERTAATTMGGSWSTPYVASAWQSGHAGAMKETRKVATLDHFSSEHLAQLAQAEFTGIAAALAQQVNRAAVEAVTLELRPTRAYALMVRPFDKQAVHRVRTNVSVIVVKAHNEAKLAAYREMGVTRVGIDPETRKRKVTRDHAHDAFNPDEPRDQHGEWTGGGSETDVLAYHGASSKIIKSVTKNGIIVGKDKNVWVAANKSTASLFAETKSKAGAHPVVFEVNVPRDKWTQFKELKNNGPTWKGGSNTASSTQKIPPEWIAGYHEVDPNTGKMNPTLKSLTKDALVEEMPTTLYVVVAPEPEDPEALPEHTTDSTTLFDRPMSKGPGSQTSREDIPSPSTIYRIEKAQEALEEEVGEEVDILTAGDELVCEECQDIADGGPYTLDEAQGLIPRHANCRCAFRPADDLRFSHDAAFEAAGVMFFTPDGRVLFVKRTDGEGWALPAGGVEPGEEPLQAAQREAAEEVGWPGDHQAALIDRRTTNGVDFRTFLQPVAEPFDPALNREHSEALWAPLETPPNPVHPGLAATIRSLLEPSSGGRNVHGVVHDAVRARVAVSAPVGAARFGRFPGRRFSYARGGVSSVLSSVLSDYSPDQPRVPAGSPGGGEWGSGDEPASSAMHMTEQVAGKAVDPEMLKALNAGLAPYAKAMEKRSKEIAAAMNVDPDLVSVSTGTQQSEMGVAAAVTNNNTGKVTMFAQYCNPKTFAGVLAHELFHVKYAQYRKALKAEQAQVDAMSDDEVRAAYEKGELGLYREFAEIYDIPKLRDEDGVSTYSAQWWARYDESGGKWSSSAVYETLSEMARKKLETGELPGGPHFQALYNVVRSFWHERKPQGYHV